MQAVSTAPANGRAALRPRPEQLLVELVRLRGRCRRQALVIAKLNEDVAMFRTAAIALNAQNTTLRDAARQPRGQPPARPTSRD